MLAYMRNSDYPIDILHTLFNAQESKMDDKCKTAENLVRLFWTVRMVVTD